MMMKGCGVHQVCWLLVIVGALNWGLVGAFQFNLVSYLLGNWPMVERVVYVLVGLAGVAMLFKSKCPPCATCEKKGM